jgi:hypothetical protein
MTTDVTPVFRSYYGRSVIKEPVWGPSIAGYFFAGGLAGASASLALGANLVGDERLARNATLIGLAGAAVSPVLLVADLGRPERFLNMLRVVKVTSPLNLGTWILSGTATTLGVAGACELLGILPRLKLVALGVAGVLGLPLAAYTGALLADTAVPVWHDARHELPFMFVGGAAASAGAAAAMATPPPEAGAARRLAVAGAVLELAAGRVMERRLGPLVSEPYRQGSAGRLAMLSRRCTASGAGLLALAGRSRVGSLGGGALLLAGSLLERLAVSGAGLASARDPKYTIVPQRERAQRQGTHATTAPAGLP